MRATLQVLVNMGSLQRLLPFWLVGTSLLIFFFQPILLLFVAYGVVLQFFVEYALHRFLLHRDPPEEQSVFNELYRGHIGHHEFPKDPEFFTGGDPWYPVKFGLISLIIHVAVLSIFVGFTNALIFSIVAIFFGSVSAYAFYEYCHTLAHLNVPKGWFGSRVTQSHLRHHFNDHASNFHVSFGMGWIDALFGTSYSREAAKQRYDPHTILSMGMDPDDLRLIVARKTYGLTFTARSKQNRVPVQDQQ